MGAAVGETDQRAVRLAQQFGNAFAVGVGARQDEFGFELLRQGEFEQAIERVGIALSRDLADGSALIGLMLRIGNLEDADVLRLAGEFALLHPVSR